MMSRSKRTSKRNGAGEQLGFELPAEALQLQVQYIAHALIDPDPVQPRKTADAELRESIAREGIIQPITVRPHPEQHGRFLIVAGERRWQSAAGVQEQIPCLVRTDQEDEIRRLVTQLSENTSKPLEPTEEAYSYQRLMELTGRSVTQVAELLGRPRSSVGDRLALLDLGPWLPLIESGELPTSYAVRVLAPLASVPDEYHRKAIEALRPGLVTKRGEEKVELGDFADEVQATYRAFMYPLLKSKMHYGKNPEFNTRKHDDECGCGGIQFALDYGAKRKCCGNPAWWGPLHRAAVKAKPKPKATSHRSAHREVKLYVPAGATTMKYTGYDSPKGITKLSSYGGTWNTTDLECDPNDLVIADDKLVLVNSQFGGSFVGTKDSAAVGAAREKWAQRWADRRRALSTTLGKQITKASEAYRVTGVGANALLNFLATDSELLTDLFDVAASLEVEVPAELLAARWPDKKEASTWIDALSQRNAAVLLTGLATVMAKDLDLIAEAVQKERQRVINDIGQRKVPWAKAPKAEKPAKRARPAKAKTVRGKKSKSRETEDEEEPQQSRCPKCGEYDCEGECAPDFFENIEELEDAEELEHASA